MRLIKQRGVYTSLADTCLVPLLDMALCFLVVLTFLFFISFNTSNTGIVLGKTNAADRLPDMVLTIDAMGKIHREGVEITMEELRNLTITEGEACVKVCVTADATYGHVMPILIELMGCDWAISVELETNCA